MRCNLLRPASCAMVLLALLTCALNRVALAAPVHTIAEARQLPLGTVVTIDGSVSTPSGAFASSFFDEGFGLQDHTAGVYVSLPTNLGIAPRRKVRVTGTLQDSFGLLILVPASLTDVTLLGVGPKIKPEEVATNMVGEATEGSIVQVEGTITQAPIDDLPFGYKLFVDDGSGALQIFVNLDTGIDVSGLAVGQRVRVTGFSSQFDTHYEIDPRQPSDLVIVEE
jgi:DNA/RNA endonuclease YhcR with UshA esterase domain